MSWAAWTATSTAVMRTITCSRIATAALAHLSTPVCFSLFWGLTWRALIIRSLIVFWCIFCIYPRNGCVVADYRRRGFLPPDISRYSVKRPASSSRRNYSSSFPGQSLSCPVSAYELLALPRISNISLLRDKKTVDVVFTIKYYRGITRT